MVTRRCPNCNGVRSRVFHQVSAVPVNSCLLLTDRQRAQSLQTADIDLAFCPDCSFIFNAAWRPELTVYSDLYEETQGFSPTFKAFHRRLAEQLIDRYDIVGKEIVEIGCGKGEFLSMLCELGHSEGIGYDPTFVPSRRDTTAENVTFKREFFSDSTVQSAPDLVCCKMTLEHIFETQRFVRAVRRICSPERGTIAFFQVPDVRRILVEAAFWDVYYEHCAYFSPSSLAHVFRNAGFEILRVSTSYDDQYLTIEASPATGETPPLPRSNDRDAGELAGNVARFAEAAARGAASWAAKIRDVARDGGRTVLWGSGSKAVAFLSSVGVGQEIEYLVDINPYRHGKFVPGTGKQIVGPEFLAEYRPDLVIAMNPIYHAEISRDLDRVGCKDTCLCAVGASEGTDPSAVAVPHPVGLRV